MVDDAGQAPLPVAHAWLFELETPRAPVILVMRTDLGEARDALAAHLVEQGHADAALTSELAAGVPFMQATVIW